LLEIGKKIFLATVVSHNAGAVGGIGNRFVLVDVISVDSAFCVCDGNSDYHFCCVCLDQMSEHRHAAAEDCVCGHPCFLFGTTD
jgi:hypothetical protein